MIGIFVKKAGVAHSHHQIRNSYSLVNVSTNLIGAMVVCSSGRLPQLAPTSLNSVFHENPITESPSEKIPECS